MTASRYHSHSISRQAGLTYVEVLVAATILALALVPALEALHTGMLGNEVYQISTAEHYAALSKMEELLAEPQATLILAAAVAGDQSTPTSYSDAPGTPVRRLVFLGLYDADNADADNNVFTVLDPNLDGDSNIFTGYTGLVWVRVEVGGSITYLESLSAP